MIHNTIHFKLFPANSVFTILILAFLFNFSTPASGQIQTREIGGKIYKVYPFTKEIPNRYDLMGRHYYKNYSLDFDFHSSNHFDDCFVPFYSENLPDGDYVMHYETPINALPIDGVEVKNIVYAIFTLKNNKKEGAATFFTYKHLKKSKKQQIYATGFFKNDAKDSVWIGYNYNSETGKPLEQYETHYKEGVFHGYQCTKTSQGVLTQYGNFINGLKHGDFFSTNSSSANKVLYRNDSIIDAELNMHYQELKMHTTIKNKVLIEIKLEAEFDKDNFILYKEQDSNYIKQAVQGYTPIAKAYQSKISHLIGAVPNGKIYTTLSSDTVFIYQGMVYIKKIDLNYKLKLKTLKKLALYKEIKKELKGFINTDIEIDARVNFTKTAYPFAKLMQMSLNLNKKLLAQMDYILVDLKDSNSIATAKRILPPQYDFSESELLNQKIAIVDRVYTFTPHSFYESEYKKKIAYTLKDITEKQPYLTSFPGKFEYKRNYFRFMQPHTNNYTFDSTIHIYTYKKEKIINIDKVLSVNDSIWDKDFAPVSIKYDPLRKIQYLDLKNGKILWEYQLENSSMIHSKGQIDKNASFEIEIYKKGKVVYFRKKYLFYNSTDTAIIQFEDTSSRKTEYEIKEIVNYYELLAASQRYKKQTQSKKFKERSSEDLLSQDLKYWVLNKFKSPTVFINGKAFHGYIEANPANNMDAWKGKKRTPKTMEFKYSKEEYEEKGRLEIYCDYNHYCFENSYETQSQLLNLLCNNGKITEITGNFTARYADDFLHYVKIENYRTVENIYRNGQLNGIQNTYNYSEDNDSEREPRYPEYQIARDLIRHDMGYVDSVARASTYSADWFGSAEQYSSTITSNNFNAEVPVNYNSIHGAVKISNQNILLELPFLNDTLHGCLTKQNRNVLLKDKKNEFNKFHYQYISDSIQFYKGHLQGRTVSFYPIHEPSANYNYLHFNSEKSIQSILPKKAELNFEKGMQVGIQKYFYESGIPFATIEMTIADSNTKGEYVREKNRIYLNWNISSFVDRETNKKRGPFFIKGIKINKNARGIEISGLGTLYEYESRANGLHTVYYNTGLVQQKGRVKNGVRTGLWEYYGENGKLFKTINYYDSAQKKYYLQDSIEARGYVCNYDTSGNKINEGYIIDQNFYGACISLQEISIEEIAYTKIYSGSNEIAIDANSYFPVTEFQITGNKRFDGFMKAGTKDSIWKYYAANGTLESIGKYENGKKEGRWLSGDLMGINFLDNVCFDPRDTLIIKNMMKNISLSETIYVNGEVQSRMETQINTEGYSKYAVTRDELFFVKIKNEYTKKYNKNGKLKWRYRVLPRLKNRHFRYESDYSEAEKAVYDAIKN